MITRRNPISWISFPNYNMEARWLLFFSCLLPSVYSLFLCVPLPPSLSSVHTTHTNTHTSKNTSKDFNLDQFAVYGIVPYTANCSRLKIWGFWRNLFFSQGSYSPKVGAKCGIPPPAFEIRIEAPTKMVQFLIMCVYVGYPLEPYTRADVARSAASEKMLC